MPAPYKFAVEQFIDYFEQEAAALRRTGSPLHRKILYAAALDPLARAAYGPRIGNRERLTRLIRELSGWAHSENVSLPQLLERLRSRGRHRQKLYRTTWSAVRQWEGGARISLRHSPLPAVLIPLAQGDEAKLIAECQYAELFYTYRNTLVHEFREPGYGWDVAGTSFEPFYMSYLDREEQWELVFPVDFFETLFTGTLAGLRTHLVKQKIDPYKHFGFGSMWRAR